MRAPGGSPSVGRETRAGGEGRETPREEGGRREGRRGREGVLKVSSRVKEVTSKHLRGRITTHTHTFFDNGVPVSFEHHCRTLDRSTFGTAHDLDNRLRAYPVFSRSSCDPAIVGTLVMAPHANLVHPCGHLASFVVITPISIVTCTPA